jgi:hypothetical protein
MAKQKPTVANLMVNIFDGKRQLYSGSEKILITIIDGNQHFWRREFFEKPSLYFQDLPIFNNFGDNYTVIACAKGYKQAGFTPVKMAMGTMQHIDLMLIPDNGSFNFNDATWQALKTKYEPFYHLLHLGIEDEQAAKDRYDNLREKNPEIIASFLNIVTAMSQAHLPEKTPLDYFRALIWDEMKPDRFFAWADKRLIAQVERAAVQGEWAPEVGSGFFHPGATKSFKQVQFGEANVQLTFHESDEPPAGLSDCVKVEPDIDYYRDIGAHSLLEVLPNTITGHKSNPQAIYVLRWIAGRHANVPEFNPPYIIV